MSKTVGESGGSSPALTPTTYSAKVWLEPLWLKDWQTWETVPPAATVATIQEALDMIEATLVPAPPLEIVVLLMGSLPLWGAPSNWETVAPMYLEALARSPAWALSQALHVCRSTLKYFPKPSEILELLPDELYRRKTMAARGDQ